MLGHGAAKGKGAAKAVGGIRGKAPVPELEALAPRPPAVGQPFTKRSIVSVSHLHSVEGLHHLKKWVQVLNPWLLCPIPLLIVLETLLDGFMGLLDLMSCIA